jgi:hypothetical protein
MIVYTLQSIVDGYDCFYIGIDRPPTDGRSPRSSAVGISALLRSAAVAPEIQLFNSICLDSAVLALTGPADSIFKPPRISG